MMLLLGLPHGATDYSLFKAMDKHNISRRKMVFYLMYGGLIGLYGLVWLLLPLCAFLLFLLLAIYHFGQSNWSYVSYRRTAWGSLHFMLWGAGVLFTPILLHGGEAAAIVAKMTGWNLTIPTYEVALTTIIILGVLNMLAIGRLRYDGQLSRKRAWIELAAYGLLMGVFFTNSLLLGFTIYFVFWHSLGSMLDQLRYFRTNLGNYSRRQFLLEIAPVVLGALAFCLFAWFWLEPGMVLSPALIGGVFVAISLLTLPHMILVDQLYRGWRSSAKTITLPVVSKNNSTNSSSADLSASS
ncbi:MAG: Brp/Blh family beta-carotene 15,15'-dioxygenase [Bacteroidota bacterium]